MNKLIKGLIIFTVLYMIWHLGRLYEYNEIEARKPETIRTYYFVNPAVVDPFVNAKSDLFVKGEIVVGNCELKGGE